MIKQFPAFTFFCLRKVFSSRSYLIIFPPLGSTFQRTLCSGWRLSVSFGFTLRVPAPALSQAGFHLFSPISIPIKVCFSFPPRENCSDLSKAASRFPDFALQLISENAALILPPGVLPPGFGMVRCPSAGIASAEVLADGAPS
jgi:hypothetical protein